MKNLTAAKKGLLIGVIMIVASFLIFYIKGNFENNLQYIVYFLYVGGIVWTLFEYKKNTDALPRLKYYLHKVLSILL
ncbi:MAG: hypothetical protein IPP48_11990 [Chitinophagaceae bacterium]|nr:hypothetical protein [Chitinophagaceae bacterium]